MTSTNEMGMHNNMKALDVNSVLSHTSIIQTTFTVFSHCNV